MNEIRTSFSQLGIVLIVNEIRSSFSQLFIVLIASVIWTLSVSLSVSSPPLSVCLSLSLSLNRLKKNMTCGMITCGMNNLEIEWSLCLALMSSFLVDWAQTKHQLTNSQRNAGGWDGGQKSNITCFESSVGKWGMSVSEALPGKCQGGIIVAIQNQTTNNVLC